MAVRRWAVRKQYSIAEARDHLPGIVHEVESDGAVELTRCGKPVAVILSVPEYCRLKGTPTQPPKTGFWEALEKWRSETDLEELWAEGDPFEGLRDRSADGGRQFNW